VQADLPDFDRSFLPVLDDAFTEHADKECVAFEGTAMTYADVGAASSKVANALLRDGFAPGDPNTPRGEPNDEGNVVGFYISDSGELTPSGQSADLCNRPSASTPCPTTAASRRSRKSPGELPEIDTQGIISVG